MWGIELQRRSGVPMARQLYQALWGRMTQGYLQPGEALPSTRELAHALGISRNTACEAYEMLSDEGFLKTSPGAPTRVAEGLALEQARVSPVFMPSALPKIEKSCDADFRTGQPDLRRFPAYLWMELLRKGTLQLASEQWGYSNPEGLPALREKIARWLLRGRGLAERPEDIFLSAGTTHALHLLACLPALSGGEILVEDPCHIGLLTAWQAAGATAHPVPVDEHGLQTGLLDTLDTANIHAVYTTPSHQFPTGGILPAGRHAALIRFARKNDLYVVEDDYDSEFRYAGAPIAPLRSMDPDRVIYVGTFSKTMYPALRVGFAILPRKLQDQWLQCRKTVDVQNPLFEQAALAEFLATRKFDRHVRQMRRLYGQRREALLQALGENFGSACKPIGDAAGLHIALQFPGMKFDEEFTCNARSCGINVTPMEYYAMQKGLHEDMLVLGYGHLELDEIRRGVETLTRFIATWQSRR